MGHIATLVLLLGFGAAFADDDAGKCSVEDWRYTYTAGLLVLTIEGSATCETGRIRVRAYDTSDGTSKFMGVAQTAIEGYIFSATVFAIYKNPASMDIKYAISRTESE